jgi:hypothetical protein
MLTRFIMFFPDKSVFAPNGVPFSLADFDAVLAAMHEVRDSFESEADYAAVIQENIEARAAFDAEHQAQTKRQSGMKRPGFVYVMHCPRRQQYKIGFSIKPEARETSLKTAMPEIRLLGYFPGTLETEARIHKKYRRECAGREWFQLSDASLNQLQAKFLPRP